MHNSTTILPLSWQPSEPKRQDPDADDNEQAEEEASPSSPADSGGVSMLGDGDGATGVVHVSDGEEGDDGDDDDDGSYDGATPPYEMSDSEPVPATNEAVTGSPPPTLSQLSSEDPCDPIQDASEEEGCSVEASQASIDFLIAEEEESAMDEKDKAQYREFLNSQDSSLVPDLLADAAVAAGGLGENVEKEKTEKEIAEDKKLPLPMEEIPVKSKDLRSSCSSKVVDNGGEGSYRKAHSTANLKISASSSSLKSRAKNAQNLAELERELSHLKRLQSAKTLADSNKMRMLFNMFRLIEIVLKAHTPKHSYTKFMFYEIWVFFQI